MFWDKEKGFNCHRFSITTTLILLGHDGKKKKRNHKNEKHKNEKPTNQMQVLALFLRMQNTVFINADWTNLHPHLKPLPTVWSKKTIHIFFMYMIIMLFVFDLQSWDASTVHLLLHCMSGLHWLFWDMCTFACALLLALDCLVYACFMFWFWGSFFVELWSALSQSSWIRRYISITYYYL